MIKPQSRSTRPKLVRLVVYVPEDLDRFLTMKALDDGRSLSSLARYIFNQYRKMMMIEQHKTA